MSLGLDSSTSSNWIMTLYQLTWLLNKWLHNFIVVVVELYPFYKSRLLKCITNKNYIQLDWSIDGNCTTNMFHRKEMSTRLGRNRLRVRASRGCQIYIISHVHTAYDYLGLFWVLWVHFVWYKNCVWKNKYKKQISKLLPLRKKCYHQAPYHIRGPRRKCKNWSFQRLTVNIFLVLSIMWEVIF